ncbi:hypothetical protein PR202_gb13573 [Eleusine coracana subsp. coracana]|uniref:Uncharacterized protein n=1 Tax=Eleusine coracana subsp. coracana TaxID=191504 RepID=A0AAV5EU39_ELECO|nr:hypothetical protein PR202_gb13573 [Eleusine coracana subsp. coracana]
MDDASAITVAVVPDDALAIILRRLPPRSLAASTTSVLSSRTPCAASSSTTSTTRERPHFLARPTSTTPCPRITGEVQLRRDRVQDHCNDLVLRSADDFIEFNGDNIESNDDNRTTEWLLKHQSALNPYAWWENTRNVRPPWIMEVYDDGWRNKDANDYDQHKEDWDSDDDNIIDIPNNDDEKYDDAIELVSLLGIHQNKEIISNKEEDDDNYYVQSVDFLGFHPYKEVIFLSGFGAVACHLNSTKESVSVELHPSNCSGISKEDRRKIVMMTSSFRVVSDEELQEACDVLRQLNARYPIDDEARSSSDEEGSKEEGKKDKTAGKKKKKKKPLLRVMPLEEVDYLLNYKCRPVYEPKITNALAQEDEAQFGGFKTLLSLTGALTKNLHDLIRSAQAKMRREVETKGKYTYEVTSAEDDNEGAMAPQQGS